MAKRFTDNEKWKKRFFKSLSTVNKLFFLYILDECDNAGVWHVEIDIAEKRIGEMIDVNLAKKELGKHIYEFDSGEKWFIPFFIDFQYGTLNPSVNAHKSVIDKLEKRKLTKKYEQFINCLSRDMDKDKDMVKDKVKDKDKDSFENFWNLYDKKTGRPSCEKKWNKLSLEEQKQAMEFIPKYKRAQPDKQFRKNPEAFINQKGWNDEIIKGRTPRGTVDFDAISEEIKKYS